LPIETIEPLDYRAESSSPSAETIDPMAVIEYCLSLMGATSYGEIYNLHTIIVDKNVENNQRQTCQPLAIELANMFSAASEFMIMS
jgi:hypothetical protein